MPLVVVSGAIACFAFGYLPSHLRVGRNDSLRSGTVPRDLPDRPRLFSSLPRPFPCRLAVHPRYFTAFAPVFGQFVTLPPATTALPLCVCFRYVLAWGGGFACALGVPDPPC